MHIDAHGKPTSHGITIQPISEQDTALQAEACCYKKRAFY